MPKISLPLCACAMPDLFNYEAFQIKYGLCSYCKPKFSAIWSVITLLNPIIMELGEQLKT